MAYIEITPIYYDLTVTTEIDWNVDIPVYDSAGAAYDFSNIVSGVAEVKDQYNRLLLSFTTGSGELVLTTGNINLNKLIADHLNVRSGSYKWDLQLTDDTGIEKTYIKPSIFTASPQITPIKIDLEFTENDDWKVDITLNNEDGSPISFSGWTAFAYIGRTGDRRNALIEANTTNGKISLSLGTLGFEDAKENHTTIRHGDYVWQCDFIDNNGFTRKTIKLSNFKVLDDASD